MRMFDGSLNRSVATGEAAEAAVRLERTLAERSDVLGFGHCAPGPAPVGSGPRFELEARIVATDPWRWTFETEWAVAARLGQLEQIHTVRDRVECHFAMPSGARLRVVIGSPAVASRRFAPDRGGAPAPNEPKLTAT